MNTPGHPGGQPDNPGRTPREEHVRRIEVALLLLSRRLRKGAIKRELHRLFGVSARTAERYLAVARKRLLAESGKTKEEHKRDAYLFYESIVSGPDATLAERMQAQWAICKLLGLIPPQRVRHGGNPGSPPIRTARREAAAGLANATGEGLNAIHDIRGRVEATGAVVATREEAREVLAALKAAAGANGG
jgi:hypothetical protein